MKNRFLIFLLFFAVPFFCFSVVMPSYQYTFYYYTTSSPNSLVKSNSVRASSPFLCLISAPSGSLTGFPLSTGLVLAPAYLRPATNSVETYNYPLTTPEGIICNFPYDAELSQVLRLLNLALSSGYQGSSIVYVNSNHINVDFRAFFSDILFGTNTFYRSQVVGLLSSISSSSSDLLQNSNLSLPLLQSFVNDFSSLNSFGLQATNSVYGFPSVMVESPLFYVGPSSPGVVDDITSTLSLRDDIFPSDAARRASFSRASDIVFADALRAFLADRDVGINESFGHYLEHPNAALSSIAGHYSTPTTNAVMQGAKKISDDVRESLSNNTQQIKKQLADWHNFASNGVREVNGNLSTIAGNTSSSSLKSAIESANIHIGDSVNVVLDGPVTIDSEQFNTVSVPLNSLKASVDNWYSQWVDFYFSSSPEKGWVKFFDIASDFKDANHSDLVSIHSCVSNLLASFSSYTNGLPFAISNAIAGLSISSTNSYLLLSDYADYIHSGGLDALLDVMDDDSYAEFKAEVDSLYHADTAEGYGRWWRYFTGLSTVQANSIFKLSNIFQVHEKLLKDLKRDNSDLDVQDVSDPSVFRKLLYTIPSEDDTFNKLSQLTNSIDQSGMARVQQLIPDLTNRFNVAAVLFDKDFHLPSEISWELIPSDSSINSKARIVTIRPSEHYRLFQMLHYGLAFSYCIVNIILLPKFLLLLVRLFDRVWNKSEKLIYNSTQS